jgi:hypothetical protein
MTRMLGTIVSINEFDDSAHRQMNITYTKEGIVLKWDHPLVQ